MSDFVTEWQFQVKGNAEEKLSSMESIMQRLATPLNKIIDQLSNLNRQIGQVGYALSLGISKNAEGITNLANKTQIDTNTMKDVTRATVQSRQAVESLGNKAIEAGAKVKTGLIDNHCRRSLCNIHSQRGCKKYARFFVKSVVTSCGSSGITRKITMGKRL